MKNIILYMLIFCGTAYADLRSAADSIKLEIEKNPDDFKSYFDLGLCYIAIDEYEEALTAFERTLELNSEYILAKYKIALVYYVMDSLEIAKLKFEELKETYVDKKNVGNWLRTIHLRCGMIYALEKQYDKAIENYQKAIKLLNRDKAPGWDIDLAMLYYKIGDSAQVNVWFDRARENLDYYRRYYVGGEKRAQALNAIYHYYLNKFERAIELNHSIYNKDKSNGIALYNLGVFKIASGDSRGFESINNAIEMDTTGFVSSVYNAINAILVDSLSNTVALLQQNIDGLQSSGVAKGLLAWTLEKLGKEGEAKHLWIKCYGQLPLGTDIESMRDFINRFLKTIRENQQ
jgi:tetratricopeptide (TPR) repeat protein